MAKKASAVETLQSRSNWAHTARAYCRHRQHIPFEFNAVFLVSHLALLTLSLLDISGVR
jgi:hypothetical protein